MTRLIPRCSVSVSSSLGFQVEYIWNKGGWNHLPRNLSDSWACVMLCARMLKLCQGWLLNTKTVVLAGTMPSRCLHLINLCNIGTTTCPNPKLLHQHHQIIRSMKRIHHHKVGASHMPIGKKLWESKHQYVNRTFQTKFLFSLQPDWSTCNNTVFKGKGIDI